MKCPKCSYIGFETRDRCRNCGYEFALAVREADVTSLPVKNPAATDGPLADLELTSTRLAGERPKPGGFHALDLDRIIGAPGPESDLPLFDRSVARDAPVAAAQHALQPDRPLAASAAPRRPLSVRRPTPDLSRIRSATPVPPQPVRNLELPLPVEPPIVDDRADAEPDQRVQVDAIRRVSAALTDAALLLAIDALVVYFTLRLCSLSIADIATLPVLPMVAFFVLLNGGYLLAFTAATGQTIGKMAFGLKVIGLERAITPFSAAVRSAVCLLSALALGAGLAPVLLGGRSLQDRLAGTTVVHARE